MSSARIFRSSSESAVSTRIGCRYHLLRSRQRSMPSMSGSRKSRTTLSGTNSTYAIRNGHQLRFEPYSRSQSNSSQLPAGVLDRVRCIRFAHRTAVAPRSTLSALQTLSLQPAQAPWTIGDRIRRCLSVPVLWRLAMLAERRVTVPSGLCRGRKGTVKLLPPAVFGSRRRPRNAATRPYGPDGRSPPTVFPTDP